MGFRKFLQKIAEPDWPMENRFLLYAVLVVGWFSAVVAAVFLYVLLPKKNLHPEQPIHFPHHVHVQQVGMECQDCHPYAEKSIHAGLPDAETCMQCHESVATESPEIVKLTALYNAGLPVEWVRIYDYPDWVYFSHKRHVLSGVRCQECHGAVELMTTVQQVPTLNMGWCLNCHDNRGAPRECDTCHQ